jgi:hypothetical protein
MGLSCCISGFRFRHSNIWEQKRGKQSSWEKIFLPLPVVVEAVFFELEKERLARCEMRHHSGPREFESRT